MDKKSIFASISTCLSAALLSCGFLYFGYFSFPILKQGNIIEVKGVAAREVDANLAIVYLRVEKSSNDIADIGKSCAAWKEKVLNIIKKSGIDYEVTREGNSMRNSYENVWNGEKVVEAKVHVGQSHIEFRTKQVDLAKQIKVEADKLVEEGYDVGGNIIYKIENLMQMREEMTQEAVAEAHKMAEVIAEKSGVSVKSMIRITQGDMVVNARDDEEDCDSYYSMRYNEQCSLKKKVWFFVRAKFLISDKK